MEAAERIVKQRQEVEEWPGPCKGWGQSCFVLLRGGSTAGEGHLALAVLLHPAPQAPAFDTTEEA